MVGRTNASVVLQTICLVVVKRQNGILHFDKGIFYIGMGDPFNDHAVRPTPERASELKVGDKIIANYIAGTKFNLIIDFIKIEDGKTECEEGSRSSSES